MRQRVLLVLLCAGAAAAQTAAPEELPPEPPYWSQGEPRPFLALDAEAGAHLRAIVSAGYGKPHWLWGGAEAYAFETLDFGALYAGLRASLLVADLQSPDGLGFKGTFGSLRLRWQWSTGEPKPGFR